ncbi:MAG TPA: hypothetical protein VJR90_11340 [Gammaproteobacteria bacterium]|nr:hypothetical protein [Gammaproteobacteria bacterium]
MIVVTLEGAVALWRQILKIIDIGYPICHLFAMPHTAAHTDTEATYAAIEVPAGVTYAPIQLTQPPANWTFSSIGSGYQAQYLNLQWVFTGAVTVYGYWISDGTNTFSLWAETFAGQFTYGAGGGVFNLLLTPWLASWPDVNSIPCSAP